MSLPDQYNVILCDLWGCVHNGVRPFDGALDTLRKWKQQGRTVVFLTNAPRPAPAVKAQLEALDIGADCYDAIVSSGDAAIAHLQRQPADRPLAFIGSARDRAALESEGFTFTDEAESASDVVCCGFADGHSNDLEYHQPALQAAAARGAAMVCLNPDIEVERGGQRELCAGAIAQSYEAIGGEVIYFGKPYAPIYDRALDVARKAHGADFALDQVLAIGDNAKTDLRGADLYGIAFVYVTSGVGAGLQNRAAPSDTAATLNQTGSSTLKLVATVDALAALD